MFYVVVNDTAESTTVQKVAFTNGFSWSDPVALDVKDIPSCSDYDFPIRIFIKDDGKMGYGPDKPHPNGLDAACNRINIKGELV